MLKPTDVNRTLFTCFEIASSNAQIRCRADLLQKKFNSESLRKGFIRQNFADK